jgi:hypothetical protein
MDDRNTVGDRRIVDGSPRSRADAVRAWPDPSTSEVNAAGRRLGHPVAVLLDAATGADLLVLGSRNTARRPHFCSARSASAASCTRLCRSGSCRANPPVPVGRRLSAPTALPEKAQHMVTTTVVICLPVADRRTSFTFYRDGPALERVGDVAEPLQFALNDGVRLMLIPTDGFGWVIGDRAVAAPGEQRVRLDLAAETDTGVDEFHACACRAESGSRPARRGDRRVRGARVLRRGLLHRGHS